MVKTTRIADLMAERGISMARLLESTGMEQRVLKAIVDGRYTASPEQRRSIAGALEVRPEQIAWGYATQVDHMYGHGPQFGRSP
jgi:lambda repressor-like predicted transcriptional regulator